MILTHSDETVEYQTSKGCYKHFNLSGSNNFNELTADKLLAASSYNFLPSVVTNILHIAHNTTQKNDTL